MSEHVADIELLGRELAEARAAAAKSLKAVADGAEISAAYLQKLERAQVETPSPRILKRLAAELDIPYGRLMLLAGYAEPAATDLVTGQLGRTLKSARLSRGEERAVAAFVDMLINQRTEGRQRVEPD